MNELLFLSRVIKLKTNSTQAQKLACIEGNVLACSNSVQYWIEQRYMNKKSFPDRKELVQFVKQWSHEKDYRLASTLSETFRAIAKQKWTSYTRFFKKLSGKPKYKKSGRAISIPLDNQNCRLVNNKIKIPKVGLLGYYGGTFPNGRLYNTTVYRNGQDWYASLTFSIDQPEYISPVKKCVGIDVGLRKHACYFDGQKIYHIHNNFDITKFDTKLAHYQRKAAKQKKGSNGLKRTREKIRKVYQKRKNVTTDFLHKFTTMVVKRHQRVSVETLDIASMFENRWISKRLGEAALGKIHQMLEYKCRLYSRELYKCNQWYASSQICSQCGHKNTQMKSGLKELVCSNCELVIDRDDNAAKNIYFQGNNCPIIEPSINTNSKCSSLLLYESET